MPRSTATGIGGHPGLPAGQEDQQRHPDQERQAVDRSNKGSSGGRPPKFNPEIYQGRNVVERAFNKTKQWRAIVTWYDELVTVYRAKYILAAVVGWLEPLGLALGRTAVRALSTGRLVHGVDDGGRLARAFEPP